MTRVAIQTDVPIKYFKVMADDDVEILFFNDDEVALGSTTADNSGEINKLFKIYNDTEEIIYDKYDKSKN